MESEGYHLTANIPTKELVRCPIQLRLVREHTLEYQELKESVRKHGVLVPLLVRQGNEVVDGSHRLEVARSLQIGDVPCHFKEMSDKEVMCLQVVTNNLRIETEPVEYARRLWRIVELDRSLSLSELSYSLNKNTCWTRRMLSLVNLCPKLEELMASGRVPLYLAVELAKVPFQSQMELIKNLGRMPNREILEMAREQTRHNRSDEKQDRVSRKLQDTNDVGPVFRPRKELLDEMQTPIMMSRVFEACKASTDSEKWKATLEYVFSIDPDTRQSRRTKNRRYNE